ncbi:MAG: 50S ribosomal protein L23 [Clostridia bacterium]|jgi:large subunit ribosomal protein L23
MKSYEDIIIRPYITERTNEQAMTGRYTFMVARKSTKVEIKQAVEKLFSVKVLKVNTLNYDGKDKRVGVHLGKTASFKKAIVTIDTNPKPETYLEKGGKVKTLARKYKTSIEEFGVTPRQ